MKLDPVIKEVYRAKEQFTREIGNDVGKLFERLCEDAKKHPERMLQPPPKTSPQKKRHATAPKILKK